MIAPVHKIAFTAWKSVTAKKLKGDKLHLKTWFQFHWKQSAYLYIYNLINLWKTLLINFKVYIRIWVLILINIQSLLITSD